MNSEDQEIAKAIRQFAALREAEAERRLDYSSDFAVQVLERIRREQSKQERQNVRQNSDEASWITWFRVMCRPIAMGGIAVAAFVTIVMMQSSKDTAGFYSAQTAPSELRGTLNLMPLSFNIDFKTSKIVLRDSRIELSGALTSLPVESSPGTNVYRMDMAGRDSTGKSVTITNGRAHFILKTPGSALKNKRDTTEVLLEGRLEVLGQGSYAVRRNYTP